ncbi:hypothetical protein [Gallaecimonas sp. GXIMD4217]|uniref:hypothetical protein n=1 Tax=Gallaecimonas sp. GXIMD4217 TaxID=3131927 RepID=UPI00311ACBA1
MDKQQDPLWAKVKRDRSLYSLILVVSLVAWLATLAFLAYVGLYFYQELQLVIQRHDVGLAQSIDVLEAKKNVLMVAMAFSIIVACLASVVLLMRQRTASLQDIQLRLGLLEQYIAEQDQGR